jgi:hypothetical protein
MRANPEYAKQCAQVEKLIRAMDTDALGELRGDVTLLRKRLSENVAVRIGPRGICPGTKCEDGLKASGMNPHTVGILVPGAYCPLCQFWITGFIFLPSMVKWFNELIEELEMAAKRQEKLYREMLDLDAKHRDTESSQKRGEIDYLDQSCLAKSATAARLYELIVDICKREERRHSETPSRYPLILAGGESARPVLEQVGRFGRLKDLNLMDHLLPAQTSAVSEKVSMEMTLGLMKMLRERGSANFLTGLPLDLQRAANIALGELMERIVPAQTLEQVFEGQKRFSEVLDGTAGALLEEGLKNVSQNLTNPDAAQIEALKDNPEKLLQSPVTKSQLTLN